MILRLILKQHLRFSLYKWRQKARSAPYGLHGDDLGQGQLNRKQTGNKQQKRPKNQHEL